MTDTSNVYSETMRAIEDSRATRGYFGNDNEDRKWPSWIHVIIAVGAVVVSVVLAYAALDKRISLMEQKLDTIIYQNATKR